MSFGALAASGQPFKGGGISRHFVGIVPQPSNGLPNPIWICLIGPIDDLDGFLSYVDLHMSDALLRGKAADNRATASLADNVGALHPDRIELGPQAGAPK